MQVTCKNCNFSIWTYGEGFHYHPDDVGFCMKCGKKYIETGVNVAELARITEVVSQYQGRIVAWLGLVPTLSLFAIVSAILYVKPAILAGLNDANYIGFGFWIIGLPLGYLFAVTSWAFHKGNKKRKELMGQV